MAAPTPPQRLTDLELEVMHVVWSHPAPPTVRETVQGLAKRGRELAYTTVQTMLNILTKKGVLQTERGPGRAHRYAPQVSRAEATSSMTRDFVDRLFGGRTEPLFAHLLDSGELDRAGLEELRRRIDAELADERSDPKEEGQ